MSITLLPVFNDSKAPEITLDMWCPQRRATNSEIRERGGPRNAIIARDDKAHILSSNSPHQHQLNGQLLYLVRKKFRSKVEIFFWVRGSGKSPTLSGEDKPMTVTVHPPVWPDDKRLVNLYHTVTLLLWRARLITRI